MGKLRVPILLPLFICCTLITVKAQTALQLGTPVERTLGPGQVHEFSVKMEENSFAQLVVEQRGIDVFVKVSSPGGKSLGEFDTPNGDEGPEHVSFVAAVAGTYRITISPLNAEDQTTGSYEIKVVELREATEQELKTNKNREAARDKGIALLTEIEPTIQQIKSPQTRIGAQLQLAELLWVIDEKRAAKFVADAIAGIKEFLATADISSDQYAQQYEGMSRLRQQVIEFLSQRDPDAALNFLQSTTPRYSPSAPNPKDLLMQETNLELSIANRILDKDPNRAAQIARRSLKSGYSSNLAATVAMLALKNRELATELVHEIAGKLLNEEKLSKSLDAANLAISLLRTFHTPPDAIPVQMGRTVSPFRPGLISEDEYKQLAEKAVGEVLSYTPSNPYHHYQDGIWGLIPGLQQLGGEMDQVIGGSKVALEKKMAELSSAGTVIINPGQEYQNAIGNNPVEAALETIEKAPADYREQLYIQLANREANNGDMAQARQIVNDHVTNPHQRHQALTNLDQQETSRAVGKGKIEEALRNVSNLKTARERAAQLIQIISQIGPGQKRAAALRYLEQARGMLSPSPQAPDAEQMYALLELARAFARYDSKRSFEIIEPLMDQFNDICAAARAMQGFGVEYFDDDELDLEDGNSVSNIATQMSDVLGNLALTNFERAKAATEKIRLPEVRLSVYLQIAQQTIAGGQ